MAADRHRLRRPPANPVAGFATQWDLTDSVVAAQEQRLAERWSRGWREGDVFIGRWSDLWE
jgi:hypothetical protein